MLKKIIEWLAGKPKVVDDKEEAAKLAKMVHGKATCGCGRSNVGHCIGLHRLSEEEWAVHPANPKAFIDVPALSVQHGEHSTVKAEELIPTVTVTEVAAVTVAPKITLADMKGWNKKQLMEKAKEMNVKVNSRMTKDEIAKKLIKS